VDEAASAAAVAVAIVVAVSAAETATNCPLCRTQLTNNQRLSTNLPIVAKLLV